ncbi:MAG TPA: PAS domain S-box protein [Candidatus Acidoferrales bacterium]|nr:PAS domain S-box protein [Candidatus Acidoferrales bacterium]
MANSEHVSYQEKSVETYPRRSAEDATRWIEPETADELLTKLKNLHAQTERHDELLSVYGTLHDNERRFREMIDALPAAIYTTDAEGRLTHFNPAAVKLSGRTPELGTDQWCVTWKLFWPDGTPMKHDECPMAVALKEGRIQDGVEAIAERPDGTRSWFIPYPRLLRDDEGRIIGGINMLLDITDRKRADNANNLLAAIVDSSDDAIVSKTLDGVITSWNRSAERLFGYTAEEAIGQHITLIVPPDRLHEEATIIGRLKRGERIARFETVRRRKDGTLLDVSLTISPVKDSAGRVVGASKVARDITERKQTEQALRKSEERLEMELAATRQLAEVSAQLAEEGNCEALYDKVLDATIAIMHSDMGSMQMLDPERGEVRLLTSRGFHPESAAFWQWVRVDSKTTCGAALRDAQRAVVPDVDVCDFMAGTEDLHFFRLSGIRAMQSTPLVSRAGHFLGMISTHWRKPHEPSEHELQLLDMLARQAGDLIERSRTAESLRRSEERLREVAGKLDTEVRERTEELEQRNAEMLDQAGQLRTLSNRLMQLQDDERRRIARELHDSVGQDLAALGMCLEGAKRVTRETPQVAVQKLDEACQIVEKCSSEIRTLSHLLHPPLLEELGLASAIEWYVEGFASRSKIEVDLQMPPSFKRLHSSVELPLFRVLQECLTNIHRHSESKTAAVKVEVDEHSVSLEISDQGKGIPKRDAKLNAHKPMGVGISGMRERLKDLGGTLEIQSTNQGTIVRAEIPVRGDALAATN